MKFSILLNLALGLCGMTPLRGDSLPAPKTGALEVVSAICPLVPGLVVTEYLRHDLQANDKAGFDVPLEKLGQAIGDKTAPVKKVTEPSAPAKPTPPAAPKAMLSPTRWPVQILYAMYGSGDRNADVTLRVKELVETKRTWFAVDPPTLGIDPIPYWKKSLWLAYVKDGVRREVRRYENEHVLPESFYGPQDAAELGKWLPASRWRSEKGELQFHSDHTSTGYGFEGTPPWEATANNKLRVIWSAERKIEYVFDFTWSSFHAVKDAKDVFHVMQ